MISDFPLINRNNTSLVRNTTIGVFGGSLGAAAKFVDEMDSNPYVFSDASNTE